MKHESKILIVLFILGSILVISIFEINSPLYDNNEENGINFLKNEEMLHPSSFWILSPILIDDTDPNKDWSNTTNTNAWCSGTGVWDDPYTIANVIIYSNGANNCIEIRNSNAYFVIRNCKLYNSTSFYAGIRLENVNNGKIVQNTCSKNGRGMTVYYSNNITINSNTIVDNVDYGTYFDNSHNNIFSGNYVNNSITKDGLILDRSENNTIINNSISFSWDNGINIFRSNNTNILNNKLSNNGMGLYTLEAHNSYIFECHFSGNSYGFFIVESDDNVFSKNLFIDQIYTAAWCLATSDSNLINNNVFKNNSLHAQDDSSNNYWDNGELGNYWDNYTGSDLVPFDGIGDTPYTSIKGGLNQDNFPIYENPTLNGNTIHIDDTGVNALSWSQTVLVKWWCTGLGTYLDPFIIEDLTINGQKSDNCISIENSDVYFIIRNCTLFNSSINSFKAGLKLNNTNNGQIINNNCSSNGNIGIYLENGSRDNDILGNIVNHNGQYGIFVHYSENNKISENFLYYNDFMGLVLSYSNMNNITGNIIRNIDYNSLFSIFSNDTVISKNTITSTHEYGIDLQEENYRCSIFQNKLWNNEIGLRLGLSCQNNIVFNNSFKNNVIQAYDIGSNNQWDNGIIGNYWDDYPGYDLNDDGIGDTPYTNITGSANSEDAFPIWDDGDSIKPTIIILSPQADEAFAFIAPNFTVIMTDVGGVDSRWYTLDNGISNVTFTSNGSISQILWEDVENTSLTIRFYCKDLTGNIGSAQVQIQKDITAPRITIHTPKLSAEYTKYAPIFNISVQDSNLDTIWYLIEDNPPFITVTHFIIVIDREIWDALPNGPVIITFFANDTFGSLGVNTIILIKDYTAEEDGSDGEEDGSGGEEDESGGEVDENADFIGDFLSSGIGILSIGILLGLMSATIVSLTMFLRKKESIPSIKSTDKQGQGLKGKVT